MFITGKANTAALEPKAKAMTWPGPRILLITPEDDVSADWIASAEHYYLVIDFATKPVSHFDALRIAITRAARARIAMTGPLLFSRAAMPDMEVENLKRAVTEDPWLIESSTDPVDGNFSMLVLGERIVENPLLLTFFTTLHEGITEMQTGGCIAAIDKHLVWREEAE